MYQFIIKSSKFFIIGLLPLLFISSIGSDQGSNTDFIENKSLRIFTGESWQELKGDMSFLSSAESFRDGRFLNSLKLRLNDTSGKIPNVVEFVLSKESKTDVLPVGNYRVNHIDGFIGHFDGVFGVANINSLGERPFFATDGTIHITQIEKNGIEGNVNMVLSNGDGRIIKISGFFEAK